MNSHIVVDKGGDLRIALRMPKPPLPKRPVPLRVDAEGDKSPESNTNTDNESEQLTTIEVTASSHIVSLLSPVFRRMLVGHFREAADFAKSKAASQQYTLSLPDDDAEAMILLLRIFHSDMAGFPDQPPSPAILEKLAFVCDKYQCTQILRFCGSVWLVDWMRDWAALEAKGGSWDMQNSSRALVFAYVADLPKEFRTIALGIVLHQIGPIGTEGGDTDILVNHPLLRDDVACKS